MKRIKLLMVLCLMGMTVNVFAQFSNAKGNAGSSASTDGWQEFRIAYHPMSAKYDDGEGDDSTGWTGLSIGYVKAFSLSQSTPIFLEVGGSLLWTSFSESEEGYDDDYEAKLNMFSVNIPVNFGYKYAASDNISIFPYIGLNFRVNAFGKIKSEYGDDSNSLNVFDKEDMGKAWKRFQAGWQIGVAANFNEKFTLSASYGQDFSEISEDTKIAMPSITLGYRF